MAYDPLVNNTIQLLNLNYTAGSSDSQLSNLVQVRGAHLTVMLNIASISVAGLTATIQGYDATSQVYFTLLAGASESSAGMYVYAVGPGCAATANVSANTVLPQFIRVKVVGANGAVIQATVSCVITP